jgi:hypothetical protein
MNTQISWRIFRMYRRWILPPLAVCMRCRADLAEDYMNDQKETALCSPMYVCGVGNNDMGSWALCVAVCLEIDVLVGEISYVITLIKA